MYSLRGRSSPTQNLCFHLSAMEFQLIYQQRLRRSPPVAKVPHFQTSSGLSLSLSGNPRFSEQLPNATHNL